MKILQSQTILQSEVKHGDAKYGNGAYLTKFGPSVSKHDVAKNNYDGQPTYWKSKSSDGKTDTSFEMKFPKDTIQATKSERDVHVHPGNINLKEVKDLKLHMRIGDKHYETLKLT